MLRSDPASTIRLTSRPGMTNSHGKAVNGGSAATASKRPTLSLITPITGVKSLRIGTHRASRVWTAGNC
jgi:hypothetical protein